MPKKADTTAASVPDPSKLDAPAAEPPTQIITARKIITVSHDDGQAAAPDAPPAEPATPIIKKNRIEPLSKSDKSAEPTTDAAKEPVETSSEGSIKTVETKAAPKPADQTTEALNLESSEPTLEEPTEKPAEESSEADTPPAESGFSLDEGDEGQHPLDEAQSEADKAAVEKQKALDKLVEGETYFLPINSVEKRRAKQFALVLLLLILVLGGAAAAWANSAGYITIPGLS